MAKINEIKEQRVVVKSVGDFAGSLQQISAARMASLRKSVLKSRRFVEEATDILRELRSEQRYAHEKQLQKVFKNKFSLSKDKTAIIIMSSNQGLCGSYNTEIFKKVETVVVDYPTADYFILGSKGQEFIRSMVRRKKIKYFPYNVPEDVSIDDLKSLIRMFPRYDRIMLVYSKYINPLIRDIQLVELTVPEFPTGENKAAKELGKFIFEPQLEVLIDQVTTKLRYALFRQQLLDSRLALYAAQMFAMQTASDNAKDLLKQLQLEYNKERRKLIDKKIQEVQAGRSLWADE